MKLGHKRNLVYKKLIPICLLIAMLLTSIGSTAWNYAEAEAAKNQKVTLKLNKSSVTLKQNKQFTCKLKEKRNVKKIKAMKWSSKNNKIARVTKKGVITGVQAGKTTISCKFKYLAKGAKKYKSKTLKCKVTVVKTGTPNVTKKPDTTNVPAITKAPDSSGEPAGTQTPGTTNDPAGTQAPGTSGEPTGTPAPGTTDEPAGTQAPTSAPPSQNTGTPALQFASQLGAGINIGNTLDANTTGSTLYLSGNAGLNLETSWGNSQKVSKEFIHKIREAGFKTIRLPVTYINHVKTETVGGTKTYTIDEDWLNRVKEIVDWALEEELYIIINIHHDGADNYDSDSGSLKEYGGEQATWLSPLNHSGEAYTQMEAKFISLWTQIATKFKDYPEQLLFADMNEYHHGYNNPEKSWCTAQNKLHQAFVDTVRATGGGNIGRYLIVPGYNTNIDHTVAKLVMPTDIEENQSEYNGNTVGHLIVEVHYYDPYTYAADGPSDSVWGDGSGNDAGAWANETFLNQQMKKMYVNFVAKGIPVIIGEFGAPEHTANNIDKATDLAYRTYYYSCVVRTAAQNGLIPIAWDNGTSYQLISRSAQITQPEIVNAIIKYTETPSADIPKPTAAK